MTNRLARETSPYLRQHADNPVDWYPWGEEALGRARAEDKPIFLSIGYAACHWCHVMAHESFEDPAIAALMNRHFINIKVDREERPDLDSIYMAATVAMTGQGGWPMSVFLTPDLQPFYCGTYFPPTPRYNMPSFAEVLNGIAEAWQNQRAAIREVGAQVVEHLRRVNLAPQRSAPPLSPALLDEAADHLCHAYDWGFGGWGSAPKFPQPMTIEFLLARSTHPHEPEKRANYRKTAVHALHAMARGGMYDVVGGGFARYSVDKLWRVPHFEKMLYDNAQLALAYLHGYLLSGEPRFRQVCQESLDFVLREMTHPLGGFYSSLDADSEGQEGKFYVWDYGEIASTLAGDFDFFEAAYALTPGGNWEGKIILQRALDDAALAARFGLTPSTVNEKLTVCHSRLLAARSARPRPATDDKIITTWNALMLQAFAEAARYLHRPDYLEAARCNATFLLENLHQNGKLLRSWREGVAKHNAYLEDYAALTLALLALYQSDPHPRWYTAALHLADEMTRHYADPSGGFFDTRDDHESLLVRPKEMQDNATPCGNSLASQALLQLAAYGDRLDFRRTAEELLALVLESAVRYPTAFAKWLSAADFALGPLNEVAILGEEGDSRTRALIHVLWATYRPRQVVAIAGFPPPEDAPALLRDRPLVNGQPSAYVCHGFVCRQPVAAPQELAAQLDATE